MARHRSFGSEFERQLAKESLYGVGLQALVRRHSLSRNLIGVWVPQVRGWRVNRVVRIAQYERKIAELERKVGKLMMENDQPQPQPLSPQKSGCICPCWRGGDGH